MKNFNLYMMGLALISSVYATAQTRQALPQPIPGVKAQQLFKKANSNRAVAQRPDTKTTYAIRTKGVRMVSLAQIAKVQRTEKADEMVKKTLLTSWTKTENDGTPEEAKITYDKYGRFSVVDYGAYKDLYTYTTDDTGAKWTLKLVRRQTGNVIENLYKEERTLDDNGRVTKKSIYDNRYAEKDLTLKDEYEYDYSQDPKGVEVKSVRYDLYDGVIQPDNIVLRKWFAPTKSYLEQNYDPREEKVEIIIDKTNYCIKRYSKNIDNKWVLSRTEDHYYSADGRELGMLDCNFNALPSCYGQKTELLVNEPEVGSTTEISYNAKFDGEAVKWEYQAKEVYSNNQNLPKTQANGDRYFKRYKYDSATNTWVTINTKTETWTPEGFLKDTYEEYENGKLQWSETGIYKYSSKGEEEGYVLPFKNGGYILVTNIEDVDGSYLTFYDKNHNVTRKLRTIYKDGKDSDSYESTVPEEQIYEEWKDGKWIGVTSDLMLGDGDNHLEVKFNAKGQMTQWDEYENGIHTEHEVYTYLDNGYIVKSYNTITNKVNESTQATIDADNVVTYIYYEYSTSYTSSQIIGGEKYVTYPTGKVLFYRWNADTQEFVLDDTWVKPLTSTAADGTETTIYREIDNNGNVVETRKDIRYDNNGVNRNESYTKVNGQWVGEDKNEYEEVTMPHFEVLDLQDPIACNDEYFYPYDGDDEEEPVPSSSTNSTQWGWKDGKWAVYEQHTTAFNQPDANTLTRTRSSVYDENATGCGTRYSKDVTSLTIKRDSRHYLLEATQIYDIVEKDNESTYKDELTEFIRTYTYNDEGLLTSVAEKRYLTNRAAASAEAQVAHAAATRVLVYSLVTNYYYTELDVVNGITDATADTTKPTFAVSGRTVSAVGKSAAISLYTLDGKLVATSATGQVEAPANGAFIAVSGAAKCKIVVK